MKIQNLFQRRFLVKCVMALFIALILTIGVSSVITSQETVVYAQDDGVPKGGGFIAPPKKELPEELREDDLRTIVMRIVNYALSFLGLLATVVIIYGGLLMVSSGGEEEQFKKGKTAVMYSIIGIIIILMAYAIVNWVISASSFDSPGDGTRPIDPDPTPIGILDDGTRIIQRGNPNLENELKRLKELFGDLQNQIVELQGMDNATFGLMKSLSDYIDDLAERIPDTSQNRALIDELRAQLAGLETTGDTIINRTEQTLTPEEEEVINEALEKLDTNITTLSESIEELPVMVASIAANRTSGNVPLTVVLDGKGSTDPNNVTIPDANYHWSYFDSNGALKTLPNKSVVEVTFNDPAKYIIKLRVETANIVNGQKAAVDGVAYIPINVDPPSADIRFTINGKEPIDIVKIPTTQALAGVSFDPSISEPGIGKNFQSFVWDFGDNTTEAYETPQVVTHVFSEAKDYRASLTVTDDGGGSNKKFVTLKIQSLIADISIRPETGGNTVTTYVFDGDNSYTDEGTILEYAWTIMKEAETIVQSDKSRFEYQFDDPGNYEARLRVVDSLGRDDLTVIPFTVESQEPITFFSEEQINEHTPSTKLFDASRSLDRDENDEISYSWDFDNDGEFELEKSDKKIVAFRYGSVGKHDVKLVVHDSYDKASEMIKQVEVTSILDVDYKADRFAAHANDLIKFKALSDNASSYYWYFADGTVEQTEKTLVTHTFKEKGHYRVALTGFDNDDNETTVTKDIYIGTQGKPLAVIKSMISGREEKVQPDVCGKDKDGIIVTRNDTVFLDAGLSINIDGTNRGLIYSWDLGDREYATSKRSTHRYNELTFEDECNEVRLVVKDRLTGATDASSIFYVRVVNRPPVFSKYIVKIPKDTTVTPVEVPVEVAGPHDYDGKITKYKFWYYYEDTPEKFGVQTVDKGFTTLTVLPRGFEGEENEVYFGVELLDNDGGTTSNIDLGLISIPLEVTTGANLPPEVEIESEKTVISAGDGVTLYANASDPQGYTLTNDSFAWDFDGDGRFEDTTSGPQVTRVYNIPGEYEIRVKVTSQGLSTTATHTIYVERITEFPLAAFLYEVNDLDVSFDGTNSQADPVLEDTTIEYKWDFDLDTDSNGDGDSENDIDSQEISPTYVYPEEGTYRVKLTITDIMQTEDIVEQDVSVGAQDEDKEGTSSLKIKSANQPITTLDVTVDSARVKTDQTVVVEATVLNADGTPYTGVVLFEVIEGSGEFLPSEVEAVNSKAKTIYKALESGTVIIQVAAQDAVFGSLNEQMILEVQ